MTTKLVALLGIVCFGVGLQILTLIYGWGLEVKSWAAIILLGVVGQTFNNFLATKILKETQS